MKKKGMIGILFGAIMLAFIIAWNGGRNVKVFETLDAAELDKIIVYPGGQANTFTEQEEKEKVVGVLRSMRLNKAFPISRDGGLSIELYKKNGDREQLVMLSDHIITDEGEYTCDRDYCEVLIGLCNKSD